MNPRQVDELHPDEYEAMIRYQARAQREEKRAAARARRGR
jgi:hypothetical protein